MKILIVSSHYYPHIFGGAEKVAQSLAEALVERGHVSVVVTLNPENRHDVKEVNGVRVHYLPNRNIYYFGLPKRRSTLTKITWHTLDTYNPVAAAMLGRVLDTELPEVVNTHFVAGFSVSAWSVAKDRTLPVVHTTHGPDLLCPRGMHRRGSVCADLCAGCRVYSWPRVHVSRKVDVLTGVSQHAVGRYVRYGAFSNATKVVIHNACSVTPRDALESKDRDGPLRFGFLGRLHPTKGPDLLLNSFKKLPMGAAQLLIAGKGIPSYECQLRKVAEGHRGIRWLGFVSPECVLQKAQVLVVPSLWEDPAPLTVLESLAHGVPVIGSRRGGIPELMGEGTGWVFDPDEPGALVGTMRQAIDSRAELGAMGERAVRRAREFSTEAMVNGYLNAYSIAIKKNKKKA